MINAWNNNEAFEPMMIDYVSFFSKRKSEDIKTTIKCSLFPIETVDTLLDTDLDSEIKSISMVCIDNSFINCGIKFKPQIGDFFVTEDDKKFKVVNVSLKNGMYDITGRSVKC